MLPSIESITRLSSEAFSRGRPVGLFSPAAPPFIGEPLPRTHLSLDRYARILGINPVHFRMAFSHSKYPIVGGCDDVWVRYSWQRADRMSLQGLAYAIKKAEEEISKFIGYPVAPSYICEEHQMYRRFYREEYWSRSGLNVHGQNKSVSANNMKVISTGCRAVREILLNAPASLADLDNDGFYETIAISLTLSSEQSALISDSRQLKVYFAGTNADPRWEIRYPKHTEVSIDPGSGLTVITFTFDSWLLINPDLQSAPTENGRNSVPSVDLGDLDAFVDEVDVYQEYIDSTVPSAVFSWENISFNYANQIPFAYTWCPQCGNTGCAACQMYLVNGCASVRDPDAGIIVPIPASYNEDDEVWEPVRLSNCREPDRVAIWYVAGDVSEEFKCGDSRDPLSDYWAQTIAALATARLPRSFCGCGSGTALAEYWQTDSALIREESSYGLDFSVSRNPFGTKWGEIVAYRNVSAFNVRKVDAALL